MVKEEEMEEEEKRGVADEWVEAEARLKLRRVRSVQMKGASQPTSKEVPKPIRDELRSLQLTKIEEEQGPMLQSPLERWFGQRPLPTRVKQEKGGQPKERPEEIMEATTSESEGRVEEKAVLSPAQLAHRRHMLELTRRLRTEQTVLESMLAFSRFLLEAHMRPGLLQNLSDAKRPMTLPVFQCQTCLQRNLSEVPTYTCVQDAVNRILHHHARTPVYPLGALRDVTESWTFKIGAGARHSPSRG